MTTITRTSTLKTTSLLLATALAACAGSATAASEIQLFGFFDQGIGYLHEDLNRGMGGPAGQALGNPQTVDAEGYVEREGKSSAVSEGSGNVSTWGLRGSEALSDDLSVAFHLESGFLADDGTIYGSGRNIFERESSLGLVSRNLGTVKFGRMPALTTGSGTTGIFGSKVNPFGAGWGNMSGGWKFAGTLATARHDNMIHYASPDMNGLKVYAQYSFKSNSSGSDESAEGSSKTNRWWALGASLSGEKYYVAAAVDCLDAANRSPSPSTYAHDAYKALVGGHVDFDLFKLYGTLQYMKHTPWIGGYSTKEVAPLAAGQTGSQKGFEAWAATTGTDFKALGGTVKASVGYAKAENLNLSTRNKLDRVDLGLGYVYPLSKRTSLYGVGGYFWQDADWQRESISANEAIVGLMHRW